MAVPQHTLSLFQRPKEGSGFIKRSIALNYKHTIAAQGGFDTASCDIAVRSQGEGQDWLNNYLGCFVQCFADNPIEPIWEGLINRITLNSGGIAYTSGLDEMSNRVEVKYSNDASTLNGVGTQVTTTTANSAASQALYGIKQSTLEFGYNRLGGTSHPNALRDTVLAQKAFPQTSITQGGGNTNLVSLELIGIFHTLEWEMVNFVTTLARTFTVAMTDLVVTSISNGATFFDNTNFAKVLTNAKTVTGTQRSSTYWEYALKIAEAGDAASYWICGITPTDWQTKTRSFYYQAQNAATEYTARTRDNLRIRNLYGQIVPPWTVRPDRGVLVTDVLVGYNTSVQVDPRLTYIFNVAYDANLQTVQYTGADDTTARGAWMLRRGFKPFGRSFGAGLRVVN